MPRFPKDVHADDAVHVLTDRAWLGEQSWKVEHRLGLIDSLLIVLPPPFAHESIIIRTLVYLMLVRDSD